MSNTLPVQVEVLGVETVNKGTLVALAVVELVLDGVPVRLNGGQVRRKPGGLAFVRFSLLQGRGWPLAPRPSITVGVGAGDHGYCYPTLGRLNL